MKMYINCVSAHARFVSLQLDWPTKTTRLLGPTTCLLHENGGIPLSALPACSSHYPYCAERQAGKLPFFTVFWRDSTWEINPCSTDCEVDALTTTPPRRLTTTARSSFAINCVLLSYARSNFDKSFESISG